MELEELVAKALDKRNGFGRAEHVAREDTLAGTVKPYTAHAFVCHGAASEWPAKPEKADGPLKTLQELFEAHKGSMKRKAKPKLTLVEPDPRGCGDAEGDVLVFPRGARFRNPSHALAGLREAVVDGIGGDCAKGEPLGGTAHVFVCAHGSRDARCGYTAGALLAEFARVLEARGLAGDVAVRKCSHIGGHKYAGNVLVFVRDDAAGGWAGDWYGYAGLGDVAPIIDTHIVSKKVLVKLWRGRMGGQSCEEHSALVCDLVAGNTPCDGSYCLDDPQPADAVPDGLLPAKGTPPAGQPPPPTKDASPAARPAAPGAADVERLERMERLAWGGVLAGLAGIVAAFVLDPEVVGKVAALAGA